VAEDDGAAKAAAESFRMTLADVPEALRAAIEEGVRRATVASAIDDEGRARIATGDPLADVLPGVLRRAVRTLDAHPHRDPAAVARVLDLLDLLEEHGVDVPFDAQTAFARVRESLAGPSIALAGIAARLGFAVNAGSGVWGVGSGASRAEGREDVTTPHTPHPVPEKVGQ